MYKIVIGDDEGIVIDALTFIIDKHFEGKCMVESAKSGREVIELAEKNRPDIVFMDLQMPGINGIVAMKEIKEMNHNTIFIVLSDYDKFDYAKEALSIGVLEYLRKPIQQDAIVNSLKSAIEKIDTERKKRSYELQVREKLETVVPIIESGLIYSVLFQENYADDTENFKQLLGIRADSGYMMIIECGDSVERNYLVNTVGASVRVQSNYRLLREIVKDHFECVVGAMMANMVIALVPFEGNYQNVEEEYQGRIEVIQVARKMVRELARKLDAQFRVGIGSVCKLGDAGESYTEALNSLRHAEGTVVHVKDLPIGCEYEEDYPIEIEKDLLEKTENGDVNGVVVQATNFFDWMVERYPECVMDIKLKALEMVLWAEKISYESGGMTYHFRARHEYLPSIIEMKDYDELRVWFITKIQEASRNVALKKEKSSNTIISRAMEYIKNHYSKDISLDDVSREVNISPYYFSKLFKDETGENFIEYVTSIRIERAKELLVNSDKSMKEICVEIGYGDANYFSRTFKKNVGVTPTEYKEGKH